MPLISLQNLKPRFLEFHKHQTGSYIHGFPGWSQISSWWFKMFQALWPRFFCEMVRTCHNYTKMGKFSPLLSLPSRSLARRLTSFGALEIPWAKAILMVSSRSFQVRRLPVSCLNMEDGQTEPFLEVEQQMMVFQETLNQQLLKHDLCWAESWFNWCIWMATGDGNQQPAFFSSDTQQKQKGYWIRRLHFYLRKSQWEMTQLAALPSAELGLRLSDLFVGRETPTDLSASTPGPKQVVHKNAVPVSWKYINFFVLPHGCDSNISSL